jgi:DNA-binding NtrC family response regulator
MRHPFPGNVRELENAIQKALIMSDGPELDMDDLAEEPGRDPAAPAAALSPAGDPPATLRAVRMAAESKAIAEALARTQGNVSAAAKSLDVDRKWLMKLMEEHGLQADTFRRPGDAARRAP